MQVNRQEKTLDSLEAVIAAKAEVRQALADSRARMGEQVKSLFAPADTSQGKTGKWMGYVERSIAIYDGAMFGIRIIRRLRQLRLFNRRR